MGIIRTIAYGDKILKGFLDDLSWAWAEFKSENFGRTCQSTFISSDWEMMYNIGISKAKEKDSSLPRRNLSIIEKIFFDAGYKDGKRGLKEIN